MTYRFMQTLGLCAATASIITLGLLGRDHPLTWLSGTLLVVAGFWIMTENKDGNR